MSPSSRRAGLEWLTLIALVLPLIMYARAGAQSRDQLVVDAAWLKQHLNDADLVVLHLGPKAEYDAGHIPGARIVDVNSFAAPRVPDGKAITVLALPAADSLRAALEALGINDRSHIVLAFAGGPTSATRVAYTLDWLGFGEHTFLLDGGFPAWKADGGQLTTDVPLIKAGKIAPKPTKDEVEVSRAWVAANHGKPGITLIDARARSAYDGVSAAPSSPASGKPGHIPDAVNIPYTTVFDETNRLQPADKLKEIFAGAGVRPNDTVAIYCWIGQQATAVVFAARTLGYKVVLYDGSFNDWAESDLPVVNPSKK